MGGNLSCWSRSVHLDLDTGNSVDGLVGYGISVEILFVSRIFLAIISIGSIIVYYTLPVLVLGNRTLGGFGGVSVDEVTAGHAVELWMTAV